MKTWHQVVAFILVSGLNTLVGYSFFALFIFIKIDYQLAILFATMLGTLFNFKTTGKFVFNSRNNSAFFKFAAVYFFIYFFNIIAMQSMQAVIANLYIAGFVVMIPAAIITFILNKLIVFRESHETN